MSYHTRPQVIYKPHYYYQNFFPLANGLCLIVITNKTPLLPHYGPDYQDESSTYRGARFENLNHKLDEDYIDLEVWNLEFYLQNFRPFEKIIFVKLRIRDIQKTISFETYS